MLTIPNIESSPTFPAQSIVDSTDLAAIVGGLTGTGVVGTVAVAPSSGMTVSVSAGSGMSGQTQVNWSATTSTATPASATDRKDIVVVSSSGTVSVVAGSPCSTAGWTTNDYPAFPPVKPAIPSGSLLLAELYISPTTTSIVSANIIDKTVGALLAAPLDLVAPAVTTETALLVSDSNGGRTGGGQLVAVYDHNAAIIYAIGPVGGPTVFGDHMRAGQGVFGPFVSLDGTTNPPSIEFPDGSHHYSGSGVPTTALSAVTAAVGDKYWRIDTPSTADQRLYICTAAGTPGTWVGIL